MSDVDLLFIVAGVLASGAFGLFIFIVMAPGFLADIAKRYADADALRKEEGRKR